LHDRASDPRHPTTLPDPQRYGGYRVPPGTPADLAERAFDEFADRLISHLSSADSPYAVGPCLRCGQADCIAVVEPWRTSVYVDGAAYVAGGLCCALTAGWPTREDALPGFTAFGECAHPMTRGELPR
jgi:hypothetical protein